MKELLDSIRAVEADTFLQGQLLGPDEYLSTPQPEGYYPEATAQRLQELERLLCRTLIRSTGHVNYTMINTLKQCGYLVTKEDLQSSGWTRGALHTRVGRYVFS